MKRIFEKSIKILLEIVSKMENKYEYEEVDDFDEDVSFDLFFFQYMHEWEFHVFDDSSRSLVLPLSVFGNALH